MGLNKKISEFKAVTATDNTTQIPLVQGLPLENCKITARNLSSSIAEILLASPEFGFGIYAKKEDLNKKVDKVTGKGLSTNDYTTAEKNKLSAIPVGAKFTDTVYTHPASHPASMITESTTRRFVTDTEKSTWNAKIDANKFQVVTELPASPTAGVFYFVKE